jgi:hypothetical protein
MCGFIQRSGQTFSTPNLIQVILSGISMRRYWLVPAIVSIALSGCYSYRIFPKDSRDFAYDGPRARAYVTNPALKKEYRILVKSKIFDITGDSLEPSAIKIKLLPLERNFACGQPALLALFTLGQLPVLLPDRYKYTFQEIYPADSQYKSFELHVATRYWFWDLFSFAKDFDGKAGQALSAQYFKAEK